jgi:hypothetical protein
MSLAQVWNDNVHPHTETFKGTVVTIPPKSFVEMDYDEAVEFKCQFTPIKTDGEKNPLPESFKMIRVVPLDKVKTDVPLVCHATGKVAANAAELAKMNAEHVGRLEESSLKELEESSKLRSENESLRAQLAALQADSGTETKRGPGRPRKEPQ